MPYHTKQMTQYAGYRVAKALALQQASILLPGRAVTVVIAELQHRKHAANEQLEFCDRVSHLGMADGFKEALNG